MNGKELRGLARIVDEEYGKGKDVLGPSIEEACVLVELKERRPRRLNALRKMGVLKHYLSDETYREAWEKYTELYVKLAIAHGDIIGFKVNNPEEELVNTEKMQEVNKKLFDRIKEIKENEIKKIQEELNQLEEGF